VQWKGKRKKRDTGEEREATSGYYQKSAERTKEDSLYRENSLKNGIKILARWRNEGKKVQATRETLSTGF